MNINTEWVKLLADIMQYGSPTYPRGIATKEIIGRTSVIDMSNPIIDIPQRKMNYKFMCGEAYWILSGSNRVSEIKKFMKAITIYSDNGLMFNGAYGPKVVEQLWYVTDSLFKDKDSRQAVMTIWRENPHPSKDIPCTLSLQFIIRDNMLHCIANMRSSDAWLGWVYDTFNFSMISAWVAIFLRNKSIEFENLQLGNLHLTVGSQHLYNQNFEQAQEVIDSYASIDLPYIGTIDLSLYKEPDQLTVELYNTGRQNFELIDSPFFTQIRNINNETI